MGLSFILSVTKLRNKILPRHTSFDFSELFLLMLQVFILNPVLTKKVADHLPCYYTNDQVEGNIICRMINYIMIIVEKYIL